MLASTPRRDGSLGQMRLGPIAEALRQAMAEGEAVPPEAAGTAGAGGADPSAAVENAQPDTS